MPPLGASSLLP